MHHQEEGRGLGCEDIYLTSLPFTSRPIQCSPSASGFQRTSELEKHSGLLYRSNCSHWAFRVTKLLMSFSISLVNSVSNGEKKTKNSIICCFVSREFEFLSLKIVKQHHLGFFFLLSWGGSALWYVLFNRESLWTKKNKKTNLWLFWLLVHLR